MLDSSSCSGTPSREQGMLDAIFQGVVVTGSMEFRGPVAFFDRTWHETLSLAEDARDCLASGALDPGPEASTAVRLACTYETTRITARITSVMAWLMARRAVIEGESDVAAIAVEAHRLTGPREMLEGDAPRLHGVPDILMHLAERSRHIYVRVARLDGLADRPAS